MKETDRRNNLANIVRNNNTVIRKRHLSFLLPDICTAAAAVAPDALLHGITAGHAGKSVGDTENTAVVILSNRENYRAAAETTSEKLNPKPEINIVKSPKSNNTGIFRNRNTPASFDKQANNICGTLLSFDNYAAPSVIMQLSFDNYAAQTVIMQLSFDNYAAQTVIMQLSFDNCAAQTVIMLLSFDK
jgi:hypothetical protein